MDTLLVRSFPGLQDYSSTWQAMQAFTAARLSGTADELWFLEHHPVFTQGQAGRVEHVLAPGATPVIRSDRGGQVTWHGPGQLMTYLLLDTRRRQLGPRQLVSLLEQATIAVLAELGLAGYARADAPGVYVNLPVCGEAKIAAIGLRFRQQGCYHGAALNIDCELEPYARINPCGHAGMTVTRLADLLPAWPARSDIEQRLTQQLAMALNYRDILRLSAP